ncbi:MAG TPA: T9SS type A sorting domain-containing protein [Rubricoccaceae bacterium]
MPVSLLRPASRPASRLRSGRLALVLGAALLGGGAHAQTDRLDPVTAEALPGAEISLTPDESNAVAARAGADLTLVGRLADGETRGFDLIGTTLYRSNGGYLEVLNVANPASPVVLGRFLADQGVVQGVDVVGTLAYVAVSRGTPYPTRGGLLIVDVSNPAAMTLVGQVPGRSVNEIRVSGTTAFLGAGALRPYNVSNPAAPVAGTALTITGGSVLGIAVEGTTAYLAVGNAGLRVVDISNPLVPVVSGTLTFPGGFATRVAVSGGRAYVSVQDGASGDGVPEGGLYIVDVNAPTAPVLLGRYLVDADGQAPDYGGQVRSVAISGTTAFVGDDNGINVVDVTNPAAPTLRGRTDFGQSGSGQYIVPDGTRAYVSSRYQGIRVLDLATPAPTVTAAINNGGFSFKVNVVNGIAYVADLLGQVRLVDVSTPTAPRELSRVQGIPNANGVDVANGIAYVVDRGNAGAGLTRINVSNPAAPVRLNTISTGGPAFGLDLDGQTLYIANGYGAAGSGPGSLLSANVASGYALLDEEQPGNQAFDVRVAGGRAYVATFGSGLSIFNVANPAAMVPLSLNAVGNFASSVEVDGTTAYLADSQFGAALALTIVDASNPAAPVVRGTADAIAGGTSVDVGLGNGYAYAAVDFVGLYQYDVTNPAAPALRTTIQSSDRATGVDVEGRYVVLADAGAGLWIFETPVITACDECGTGAPEVAVAAFPNPTAGAATVEVRLADAADVSVEVFSVLGQRVARVDAGTLAAGTHALAVDTGAWATGVYVVRLTAGGQTATSRLTVAR